MVRNTFTGGKMDLDVDERLLPKNQYRTATNIKVINSTGSDIGAIEKSKGNELLLNLNLTNGLCIGALKDSNKETVYYFLTSDTKDLIIEYNFGLHTNDVILESSKTHGILNFSKDNYIGGVVKIINEREEKDLLIWTDNLNPPRCINIERAKTYVADSFTNDDISLIKKPPAKAPVVTFFNEITKSKEAIQDQFLYFSYRYKYIDGEYSALSPFSYCPFEPKDLDVDFLTFENRGMVNTFNAYLIALNTGGKNVVSVELVFKKSNSNTIFLVEEFDKEILGLGDDIEDGIQYQFFNNKIYSQLPSDELFRSFDNVPKKAKTVAYIGNKLVFGNYTEGFDIIDQNNNPINIDFVPEIESEEAFEEEIAIENLTDRISIDITDFGLFTKNKVLSFTFNLKTSDDNDNGIYSGQLDFSLNRDYVDKADLLNDEDFSQFVENTMTYDFNEQETSDRPLNYTKREVIPYYMYSYGDEIRIKLPYIKYYSITTNIEVRTIIETTTTVTIDDGTPDVTVEESDETTNTTTTQLDAPEDSDVTTTTQVTEETTGESGENIVTVIDTETRVIVTYSTISTSVVDIIYYQFDEEKEQSLNIYSTGGKRSLKSIRDYEVGIVYLDEYNRATPVLTTLKNTVTVKQENSDKKNTLSITVNNIAPKFAKRYKFAVKQVENLYYNIFGFLFFKEEEYVWIKLESSDEGKVKQGDYIYVKSDSTGIINNSIETKVLEVSHKDENFISNNSIDQSTGEVIIGESNPILEPEGFYMKIKPINFNITYNSNTFFINRYYDSTDGDKPELTIDPQRNGFDLPILKGAYINFKIDSSTERTGRWIRHVLTYRANNEYASLREFYASEVGFKTLQLPAESVGDQEHDYQKRIYIEDRGADGIYFKSGLSAGRKKRRSTNLIIELTVRNPISSNADIVFETQPLKVESEVYYETSEVFDIEDGKHLGNEQNQTDTEPAKVKLGYFNCYVMGSGVESISYLDTFGTNYLNVDTRVTSTIIGKYKEDHRFADLTYSEPYNDNSNYNGLNEFNLSKGNYLDSADKSKGEVCYLLERDGDLIVFQSDKVSRVLVNKSMLNNADGSPNLISSNQFLNQVIPFKGEFGCKHPESIVYNGFHVFWVDVKRGTILKLSASGIDEINHGIKSFLRKELRSNLIDKIQGSFDESLDQYFVSFNNFTLSYMDLVKGWTSFHSFTPDLMIGVNNHFSSFKEGSLYLHHSDNVPTNYFYGEQHQSLVTIIFNDAHNQDKIFKSIVTESSNAWKCLLKTNFAESTIYKDEFKQKESRWFAYTRNNEQADNLNGNTQGIGVVDTIDGLRIYFNQISNLVSVGDELYQLNGTDPQLIGTITEIDLKSLKVNAFTNAPNFDAFCFSKKSSRIEGAAMRGYYLETTLIDDSEEENELFAVNSNAVKSFL